jgi:hypothetical protein
MSLEIPEPTIPEILSALRAHRNGLELTDREIWIIRRYGGVVDGKG